MHVLNFQLKLGFSTTFLRAKYYQWILEQRQKRKRPLIQKPNVFGQSAREMGTFASEDDFKAEQRQLEHDSILLQMCDERGSWLTIQFCIKNKDLAAVELLWQDDQV